MVKAKSHLLKHEVPDNVDTAGHFGTDDKKEIARKVAAMGQRQLQVSRYDRQILSRDFGTLRRAAKGAAEMVAPSRVRSDGADLLAERFSPVCRTCSGLCTMPPQVPTITIG